MKSTNFQVILTLKFLQNLFFFIKKYVINFTQSTKPKTSLFIDKNEQISVASRIGTKRTKMVIHTSKISIETEENGMKQIPRKI